MTAESDHSFMARLLSVADGTPDDTAARLAGEDPHRVASALLTEIGWRARLFDGPPTPVTVQFDLGVPQGRLEYLLTVDDDGGKVEPGRLDDPLVTVRQDLGELLRAVYGPAGPAHDGTREVHVKNAPGPAGFNPDDPWWALSRTVALGAHRVVKACSPYRADLTTLAIRFNADKWGGHWYTPHYERHFEPLRDQRVKILEIGIGGYIAPDAGGASLRMWKHFFRRGLIYGLDIFDKAGLAEPRFQPIRGDQGDPAFLDTLGTDIGPLDIVIDDGSHLSNQVITSFHALFPHVRPGGLYVVEDLQTSYWPGWDGSSESLHEPTTSMGFLKAFVDGIHHRELVRSAPYDPSPADLGIRAVHFYHNVAFIEKGVNGEQAAPPWVSRDRNPMQWLPRPEAT